MTAPNSEFWRIWALGLIAFAFLLAVVNSRAESNPWITPAGLGNGASDQQQNSLSFHGNRRKTALAISTPNRSTDNVSTELHAKASYYGFESGRRTANGERFIPMGLTAAHRTLPFGARLRVTYRGRSVIVRINDRGPAKYTGRDLDLSRGAARAIGLEAAGVGVVTFSQIGR